MQLYAWAINAIAGQQLTDSSNGYRAFRIEVLDDIVPHLVQDQYQTAEVVITASSRGWRITEQPTMWHPRASGTSKKGGNLVFGLSYARVILTTWARVTRWATAPAAEPPGAGGRAGRRRRIQYRPVDLDRPVVEVLEGGGELLGQQVDAAPGHPARAGARRRGDAARPPRGGCGGAGGCRCPWA